MASLEQRNGNYRIVFRYAGRKFSQSLATNDISVAAGLKAALEQRIKLVKTNVLPPPPTECSIEDYLIHGTTVQLESQSPSISKSPTFSEACEIYFGSFLRSSIEEESFKMLQTHKRNLIRHIGSKPIRKVGRSTAQTFINKRSEESGIRGNSVAAVTIRKEITTLKSILKWAKGEGFSDAAIDFSSLRYPKSKEKPPFQTLQEIKQKIAQHGLTGPERDELWDCLFLNVQEIDRLLAHVKKNAHYSFLYPMFAFAAYTGARRSEMLRAQLDDIDMVARRATIREKKRVRGKTSTRRVPISDKLFDILRCWLNHHPGGQYVFCFEHVDFGRKVYFDGQKVDVDAAHKKFKSTLRHSEWSDIRGWHCLRHSFCSNCAAAGVEQRIINSWVGHQTEEMVSRYRHLFPHLEKEAIESVFG